MAVFTIAIIAASIGIRVGAILGHQQLGSIAGYSFWLATAVSSIWLLLYNYRVWVATVLLLGLVACHSFAQIYWPSLRFGIPVQDFLLQDEVSAHYSFNGAKLYLRNLLFATIPAFAAAGCYQSLSLRMRRVLGVVVGVVMAINFLVIFYQAQFDLNFLAQDSGSAVSAGRAPGLLEDSGASTVYASSVVVGILYLTLFGHWSRLERIICGLIFVTALAMGAGTGGRIYFVSVGLGCGIGVFASLLQRLRGNRRGLKILPVLFVAIPFALVLYRLTPWDKLAAIHRTLPSQPASFAQWINDRLLQIDPIRAVHVKTMFKAYLDHPWMGTGLGSFYANFYHNLAWATQSGGVAYADPPANFYLMLLSELGVVGLLLVALMFVAMTLVNVRTASSANQDVSQAESPAQNWRTFAAGAFTALSVSFIIGTHILFISVCSIISLIIFANNLPNQDRDNLKRISRWTVRVAIALLVVFSIFQVLKAPRQPEFRWAERGKPQVPLSLNVPIDTHGYKGIWVASGAEFLFEYKRLEFFIEFPPEFYPLVVQVELIGVGGEIIARQHKEITHYDQSKPWQLWQVLFVEHEACPQIPTRENFCSFRIISTPRWKSGGQEVGAFLITGT